MYTLPQAKQLLFSERMQTTTGILPIALCHPGHEVHHSTSVRNNHQKSFFFFLPTFDASLFKPHLSLENRDPLNNPFFMLFIQSTWLMYLPCSSNEVSGIVLFQLHSVLYTYMHTQTLSVCCAQVLGKVINYCPLNGLWLFYRSTLQIFFYLFIKKSFNEVI